MSLRPLAFVLLLLPGIPACSASGGASRGGTGSGGSGGGAGDSGSSGGSSGASTGGGKVGDACNSDSDCSDPAGAQCFQTVGNPQFGTVTFPGGYCSKACSGEGGNECGTSGGCTDFGTSSGGKTVTLTMCTAPCKSNDECRTAEGYHCQILLPGFGFCAL